MMPEGDAETKTLQVLSCPLCGQGLVAKDGEPPSLSCPSQHEFTLQSLMSAQSLRTEALIRAAMRFLDEQERLARVLARHLSEAAQGVTGFRLEEYANQLSQAQAILGDVLEGRRPVPPASPSRFSSLN
jgi:hypothetical protein